MSDVFLGNVIGFIDLLRVGGVAVHAGRTAEVATALEHVGLRRRGDVRAALRCLLIGRREDIGPFDRAFDRFWRAAVAPGLGASPPAPSGAQNRVVLAAGRRPLAAVPDDMASEGPADAIGAWSARETLRTRDFAALTPAELMQAEALLARLPWRLGVRRTRRWVRAGDGRVHLRGVVRVNMKHGGEILELPRRARLERPRPIVVLADVSGSMERYARMLLRFVHGMTAGPHVVESFVFATRLTRITRDLLRRPGDRPLSTLARRVQDWGGGTRIGEALRAFNLHYARRVMRHGPVVLIISDGWDRGDPQQLARELARVRRSCRRLVWLNPLLGSANYQPLTRGMQAALPLVDDFLPAHNLVSLEQLADRLRSLDSHAH